MKYSEAMLLSAKEAVEIGQAILDGKVVQCSQRSNKKRCGWVKLDESDEDLQFGILADFDYRVVEQQIRPWKPEEAAMYLEWKATEEETQRTAAIINVGKRQVQLQGPNGVYIRAYEDLARFWKLADGTPCGVEEPTC